MSWRELPDEWKEERYRTMRMPVKVGDELPLEIVDVGAKGDGIARHMGLVVFVPKTRVGDKVKVRITRVLAQCAFGEAIK